MSVPGGTWFDAGRPRMHVAEPAQLRDVFLATADVCKQSVEAVLATTGHTVADIDFLCVYQGTPWLRGVVHEYLRVGEVKSVETFTQLGYLSAAMIPVNLFVAESEHELGDDDLVVLTGGGTGMTYGAAVLRWGR
jgi:3-oxoacyl-[acyl-carrier-protein] synthase-3